MRHALPIGSMLLFPAIAGGDSDMSLEECSARQGASGR